MERFERSCLNLGGPLLHVEKEGGFAFGARPYEEEDKMRITPAFRSPHGFKLRWCWASAWILPVSQAMGWYWMLRHRSIISV